jgi:hypothetical protein
MIVVLAATPAVFDAKKCVEIDDDRTRPKARQRSTWERSQRSIACIKKDQFAAAAGLWREAAARVARRWHARSS